MAVVKIHEAKTNLSKLIARVEAGEEIIIARDDKPVAKLSAAEPSRGLVEFAKEATPYDAGLLARITADPDVCGGRPCIRGMRIRVADVVGLLAGGTSRKNILADYPYLEAADIDAALSYAAGSANHRVIRT
ncbi:MAG: type II toxin-antitoxin system prevent-host-death family antitoxin [Rhizomicrobium sp.]